MEMKSCILLKLTFRNYIYLVISILIGYIINYVLMHRCAKNWISYYNSNHLKSWNKMNNDDTIS